MPTALDAVVRHVLLPARRRLLQPARRTAASRSRPGPSGSGSASRRASTSAPRRPASCRRSSGAGRRSREDRPELADRPLWKPGDSIQLAIGQKDVAVTPIQMARFYALIANGGKLVTPAPRPGRRGAESGKGAAHGAAAASRPAAEADRRRSRLPPGRSARASTRRRTTPTAPRRRPSATSRSAIAGKTGTAEKVDHAARLPAAGARTSRCGAAGAPVDKPTIVVCAVIENGGHGGEAAAPAAAEVLAKYFHVPAPKTGSKSD